MAKRQLITKEFLIHKLTRYVEKEGIVPKKREFGYTTPITKYFGSYNKFFSFFTSDICFVCSDKKKPFHFNSLRSS